MDDIKHKFRDMINKHQVTIQLFDFVKIKLNINLLIAFLCFDFCRIAI